MEKNISAVIQYSNMTVFHRRRLRLNSSFPGAPASFSTSSGKEHVDKGFYRLILCHLPRVSKHWMELSAWLHSWCCISYVMRIWCFWTWLEWKHFIACHIGWGRSEAVCWIVGSAVIIRPRLVWVGQYHIETIGIEMSVVVSGSRRVRHRCGREDVRRPSQAAWHQPWRVRWTCPGSDVRL